MLLAGMLLRKHIMKPPPIDPPQINNNLRLVDAAEMLLAHARAKTIRNNHQSAMQAMLERERRPPARTAPTPTVNHLSSLENNKVRGYV